MQIKRLLNTERGRLFISILLGLGLASLFRKACKKQECIIFRHPDINQVHGKIFKSRNKCYKYTVEQDNCNLGKKILE
tara:strand:+ start:9919 stop:10152 length:234 start_codon:yes stop_codon:yes gene_type:complete